VKIANEWQRCHSVFQVTRFVNRLFAICRSPQIGCRFTQSWPRVALRRAMVHRIYIAFIPEKKIMWQRYHKRDRNFANCGTDDSDLEASAA